MATVKRVEMLRRSFQQGMQGRVRMLVLHATAGRAPGDHDWLRRGGGVVPGRGDVPVSIHYYIDKRGTITQMVDDADIAWHAGESRWHVDGRAVNGCNPISLGIELENRNTGSDPYPQAQYDATLALSRELVAKYNIPRSQLVRHIDIAPWRKTDPRGFPWERFVSEVYSGAPSPTPGPVPKAEPLPADAQLRRLLVDLAFRAAGGAAPAGWPLLKASVSRSTGMPVAILSTDDAAGEVEAENDTTRPLALPGLPPLLVETYGRDMFYAVPDQLDSVQRLSESGPGPVRDGLLQAMFRQADPAQGFQPTWLFHQYFLAHPADVGVPLGPNHKLPGSVNGQQYACQHFAVDTLCSPVGQWDRLIRLSDLTRDMYSGDPHDDGDKQLRTLLLNDLYQTRTGRAFDPGALFCRFAIANGLGAPTARAEVQTLDGRKLVAMPYALDVLYCRIPADGNWERVSVGVLGIEDDSGLGRLSALLTPANLEADFAGAAPGVLGLAAQADDILPQKTYRSRVLGKAQAAPSVTNLSGLEAVMGDERGSERVELVVVYPTADSAARELAAAAQPAAGTTWHYYVGIDGTLTRLVPDERAARAANGARWEGRGGVDARSLAVAVEGAAIGELAPESQQARALAWLLDDLCRRHRLVPDQVVQAADLAARIGAAWEAALEGIAGH